MEAMAAGQHDAHGVSVRELSEADGTVLNFFYYGISFKLKFIYDDSET